AWNPNPIRRERIQTRVEPCFGLHWKFDSNREKMGSPPRDSLVPLYISVGKMSMSDVVLSRTNNADFSVNSNAR
ncbi:hypothetical protein N7495_005346, partial [Penicillium taxi]|uniref:uncharacterized protein n=1 Tax=Penicillium taxi TaxID=168475 RepID=UPI002545B949